MCAMAAIVANLVLGLTIAAGWLVVRWLFERALTSELDLERLERSLEEDAVWQLHWGPGA